MNIIEFEKSLAKIGKCLYIHSHGEALRRFKEFGPDAEWLELKLGKFFRFRAKGESEEDYWTAFEAWDSIECRYHCVEVCDACDVLVCVNKHHKHEWGGCGFGHTLHEAFAEVIELIKNKNEIDYSHLLNEIDDLKTKVAFWNNAWHEQRLISGKEFWATPYKINK